MITIAKKIIQAIVNDFKSDGEAIKNIATGNIPDEQKEAIKERLSFFKEPKFYGMLFFILLCLGASFTLGWLLTAKYYEVQAHNAVVQVVADAQAYCQSHGKELPITNYTLQNIFNTS